MINNNKRPHKMLRVKPTYGASPINTKLLVNRSNPKLYVGKSHLNAYFNTLRNICETESCEKLRKDSNVDLESSSATTPCCFSEAESKRTIATNTESVRGLLFRSYGSMESLQPQFGNVSGANYFMFPVYGIREQSVQTASDEVLAAPKPLTVNLSGKRKKCEKSTVQTEAKESEKKLKILLDESPMNAKADLCINKILKEDIKKR